MAAGLLQRWVKWTAEWIPWAIALMAGAIACVSEVLHKNIRLTAEGIVRQSGLLGRKQLIVPYHEIELVKVETPGRGTSLDVGTVTIRAKDQYLRLVAIVTPYDVADLIEQQRRLAGRP